MNFIDYIKGNRKGKDAHRIEIEAMKDPFLSDAIEGYDSVKGDHIARISKMRASVHSRVQPRRYAYWRVASIAASVAILVTAYFTLFNKNVDQQSESMADLYVYVPDSYFNKDDVNRKDKPIVEIENIEVLENIQDIAIYIPDNYLEHKKNNIQENEIRSKTQVTILNVEEIFRPDEPIIIYLPN